MNRLSLTTRMSLMFMLAVTAVLTVAGVSFNRLSQHHFKMLDQEALNEKLHSTQRSPGGAEEHRSIRRVKARVTGSARGSP